MAVSGTHVKHRISDVVPLQRLLVGLKEPRLVEEHDPVPDEHKVNKVNQVSGVIDGKPNVDVGLVLVGEYGPERDGARVVQKRATDHKQPDDKQRTWWFDQNV